MHQNLKMPFLLNRTLFWQLDSLNELGASNSIFRRRIFLLAPRSYHLDATRRNALLGVLITNSETVQSSNPSMP